MSPPALPSPAALKPGPSVPPVLKYLAGYPPALLAQVRAQLVAGQLAPALAARYAQAHTVRTDAALFEYTMARKTRYMRNAGPLARVAYDSKLKVLQHALGTHTRMSRVQGGRLTAKREIRIASLFRDAPADFLEMIVVHELAHLKEPEHDKAFYALCCHMLPSYHQLEFDLRLHLTVQDLAARRPAPD